MKRLLFNLIFFGLLLVQFDTFSQTNGSIKIIQDPRIDRLLMIHTQFKTTHPAVDGYKIQIFMDSGNDAVDRGRAVVDNFTVNYPEVGVELSYAAPYYRVRIGNFRNRIEAEGYLMKILPFYSQAFVIKDKILP